MVKDFQVNPVSNELIHADFTRIMMDQKVRVDVPLVFEGMALGVKTQGGLMDVIMREVAVESLPADIPDRIHVDLSPLKIGDSVKISDLQVSDKVKIMEEDLSQPIVIIAAPRIEAAAEGEEEEAKEEGQEPEAYRQGQEDRRRGRDRHGGLRPRPYLNGAGIHRRRIGKPGKRIPPEPSQRGLRNGGEGAGPLQRPAFFAKGGCGRVPLPLAWALVSSAEAPHIHEQKRDRGCSLVAERGTAAGPHDRLLR